VARHVVEQYLALLAPLGIITPRLEFHLPTVAAAETRVDDWLTGGASRRASGWSSSTPAPAAPTSAGRSARFAELARAAGHDAGAHVVVAWGPARRARRARS
jgi:hypothetical protein